MTSRQLTTILLLTLALPIGCTYLAAQAMESPIVNPLVGAKFAPIPNAPECFTIAVEKGDPTKGPSVILARFARPIASPLITGTLPPKP